MTPGTNPRCWARHTGLLACEPRFVAQTVAAVKAGIHPLRQAAFDDDDVGGPMPTYSRVGDGVGLIRLDGPLGKAWSKFGGTSTVWAREQLRAALADPEVGSILLVLDSPGGYVAGTEDLADDVRAAGALKPVVAYCEDLCASAAYWIASQAGKVYANAGAFVGSIGVLLVIEDSSKAAELAGVKVHVVSTGPLKGAGVPGTEVTPEMVDAWQAGVDDTMARFGAAVRRGREMTPTAFGAVSTGDVWIASKAKELGLIDGIRSIDHVVAGMPKPRRAKSDSTRARLRLADQE